MKKIGQIMEEMGFNPESTPSSKAAFIKYLAKQAYNVNLEIPEIYQTEEESGEASLDAYLNRETPNQTSNVKTLFKEEKKSDQPKQLEFILDERGDFKKAE